MSSAASPRATTSVLIDDILLSKAAHMNFWRLTQRPVQREVYNCCDRLGLMTQTDLPLFGKVRHHLTAEVARQAGAMERFICHHPCNVVVSFINEPSPTPGSAASATASSSAMNSRRCWKRAPPRSACTIPIAR